MIKEIVSKFRKLAHGRAKRLPGESAALLILPVFIACAASSCSITHNKALERRVPAQTGEAGRKMPSMGNLERKIGPVAAKITTNLINSNIRYKLGSKIRPGKSIRQFSPTDCSGFTLYCTLETMEAINRKTGTEVFDMARMKTLVPDGAAFQIQKLSGASGLLNQKDVDSGNIPPGTLIGIRTRTVPKWAEHVPNKISHIVKIVELRGELYVAQCSPKIGVHSTPFKEWLKDQNRLNNLLFAVDPYAVAESKICWLRIISPNLKRINNWAGPGSPPSIADRANWMVSVPRTNGSTCLACYFG